MLFFVALVPHLGLGILLMRPLRHFLRYFSTLPQPRSVGVYFQNNETNETQKGCLAPCLYFYLNLRPLCIVFWRQRAM